MAIDDGRLINAMLRADAGEELVIGFLGGSITQGSLSSSAQTCYAALVYQWWVKTFPKAAFHYVNAGIGGTDSLYGAARAWSDMLMYHPDVVVADFSVNDAADTAHVESYEGTVRRLLSADCHPAVVLLCNARYDNGETAEAVHRLIADYYGLSAVSIKDSVYSKILKGEYSTTDLSPDGLHPNDRGHALVAAEVIKYLSSANKKMLECLPQKIERKRHESIARDFMCTETQAETQSYLTDKYILPQPFTANAWENARRLTIANISPVLHGFRADSAEKMGHLDHFKNGWIGARNGDSIKFALDDVSNIALQYRKTVKLPACKASCKIQLNEDNDISKEISLVTLDGNFAETWGDCLYLETVLLHGKRGAYTVEINVTDDGGGAATPFYLLSLIVS